MPITITLEGEDEARVSALVDAGVFGSAFEAVAEALRAAAERAGLPASSDGDADPQPSDLDSRRPS
jgi:Arc/MetJ-type ribon-helix-helix transcriptional regulator